MSYSIDGAGTRSYTQRAYRDADGAIYTEIGYLTNYDVIERQVIETAGEWSVVKHVAPEAGS